MSAVAFPVRAASGHKANPPEDSFLRVGYQKTPTNPRGYHWGVDIDREDFNAPSISDWIIQLPEKAKLIDKGYDDEGAGYWMEWQFLVGPWKGRYGRFFHMSRKCGFPIGTVRTRGFAAGRVGSTGHSTGAHLHFELAKTRWDKGRDPRWNPTQAFRDAV